MGNWHRMNDTPHPGKFEGNISATLAEYLYIISLEQGCDEFFGYVDESGWYGLLRSIDKPNTRAFLKQEFGTEPEINWHYILNEDTQGFFTYKGYDGLDEVNTAWKKLIAEKKVFE